MDKFIKNLARGAGAILRDGFRREIEVKHKAGFWDVVTKYDLASEKFLVDKIKRKFPGHGILSEEGMNTKNKKNFWVMDPLDGTRNFSRGIPIFCTSISYVRDGNVVCGAVYDPNHDELFYAQRNKGAWLGRKRLKVVETDSIAYGMSEIGWNVSTTSLATLKKINHMVQKEHLWNINLGAVALALSYVAAGRYDFEVSVGGFPWDYSASSLIAEEAGAKVTNFRGRPFKWDVNNLVAAHPKIHKKILQYLK